MPIWLIVLMVAGPVLLRGMFSDLRRAAFKTFCGFLAALGLGGWMAFIVSGGRLAGWAEAEIAYWDGYIGPIGVAATLVVTGLFVLHLLAWIACFLHRGSRRRDSTGSDGLVSPADWIRDEEPLETVLGDTQFDDIGIDAGSTD